MGTRISEETVVRPKPMVEIGGMPIIWHIMKYLSCYGINDFIVCSGYKSSIIKDFFLNLHYYQSDITINSGDGKVSLQDSNPDNWKVTIIDSGVDVATGGRILSAKRYLRSESFLLTYGDGVSNVDVDLLVKEHNQRGNLATVTAVKPKGRYGHLFVQDHKVESFVEKNPESDTWINGGFFILEPQSLSYIDDLNTPWEQGPMQKLAEAGELNAYLHSGFWQSMDTLRERNYLEEVWNSGQAPWKIWK